nr:uncharacterized protein LOC109155154 [Ipomoea batatas]
MFIIQQRELKSSLPSAPAHQAPAHGSGGWINLPQGGLKLNVDAANDKNSLNTGFGFILLDSDGHLVAVMEGNWKGFLHAKMAEAIAVREALKWLKTLGFLQYHRPSHNPMANTTFLRTPFTVNETHNATSCIKYSKCRVKVQQVDHHSPIDAN